jgi:pimeloyl-ACP methyl ester carboxylesterase
VSPNKIKEPMPGKAKPYLLSLPHQHLTDGANDLYTQDGQFVCIHLPAVMSMSSKSMRLLVVVHGYSARRNSAKGRQAVRRFTSFWGQQVAGLNLAVMAPHFDEKLFQKDYQRLNRFGLRADLRLNQLIDEASELIPHLEAKKCFLLGFSGGGQFAHRYAAFHGNRFSRIVVGAPGWFMWPDSCLPYPLGMGEPNSQGKGVERLRRLCRRNMLLLVGENDHTQGAFRKRYHRVDLCVLQGAGRRERAVNWFSALEQMAIKENFQLRCQLQILKHTAHRINQHFVHRAVSFFVGTDDIF